MHTNILRKAALSLFLFAFGGSYGLVAQNLEIEFLKTQQEAKQKAAAEKVKTLYIAMIPFDISLTLEENHKRQEEHQKAEEQRLIDSIIELPLIGEKWDQDSISQYIVYEYYQDEKLREEKRDDSICTETLRWVKEFDESINKTPRDLLFKKFIYQNKLAEIRLITYNYSDSIMSIDVGLYMCSPLPLIKNIEAAESEGWLNINFYTITKSMSVEALPLSRKEKAQELLKEIEQNLNSYGARLNYSFAQYKILEKKESIKSVQQLYVFRKKFSEALSKKIGEL